jgi:hypothetical protein
MLASASPRKPSVAIRSRSSSRAILLVEWRRKQRAASSRSMPASSSWTLIRALPPSASSIRTAVARVQGVLDDSLTTETDLDDLAGRDLSGDAGRRWIFLSTTSPSVQAAGRGRS